jgi:Tfp pilus assembly protein PilO
MRFVALGVATLLVLGGWFLAAYKPANAKLADVRAQVQTTKDEVASLTQKLAHLQELKKNEKTLRAKEARFAKALPPKAAVSDFIRQVQDASNQAGIGFLSISPSLPADVAGAAPAPAAPADGATVSPTPTPTASPGSSELPVAPPVVAASPLQTVAMSLTATGKFFEIESFVSKLEHLTRALRVDTFALSGATEAGGSPKLTLSITLRVYLNKLAPVAPPAAATTAPTTSGS